MPKPRRVLGGALLAAAATALTVKSTLDGPVGEIAPPDALQHELGATRDQALAQSKTLLDEAGQRLAAAVVPGTPASVPVTPSSPAPSKAPAPAAGTTVPHHPDARPQGPPDAIALRRILRDAALRHQLDPKLLLAVSYWESGWDQSRVSETGAVGLMQVEPATAQEAGPALLGRTVDISDPYDNADVGAAILKEDLDAFHDPAMALAAYYQGPTSLRANGMFADTQQYVQGILDLATRMTP
jgi:soluble lytic murein transglycosylase-like protein